MHNLQTVSAVFRRCGARKFFENRIEGRLGVEAHFGLSPWFCQATPGYTLLVVRHQFYFLAFIGNGCLNGCLKNESIH